MKDSAFPRPTKIEHWAHGYRADRDIKTEGGLTKRELISTIAMAGILANPHDKRYSDEKEMLKDIASVSIAAADALMRLLGIEEES